MKKLSLSNFDSISVRLGEYNTDTDPDCVIIKENNMEEQDCTDPHVDIGIEEVIPHEGYNEALTSKYNDIGLIRLAQDVVETEFIKAVCLPSVALRSATGSEVFVAGWGRTLTCMMIYSLVVV